MKISLLVNNRHPNSKQIKKISQKLNLYSGIAHSKYKLFKKKYNIKSYCLPNNDSIVFECSSDAFGEKQSNLQFDFPYPSENITGSNWQKNNFHSSKIISCSNNLTIIERVVDDFKYYIYFYSKLAKIKFIKNHQFLIIPFAKKFKFKIHFSKNKLSKINFKNTKRKTRLHWNKFWNQAGFVDFTNSKDERANELQRRIILSQYLLKINSLGNLPPQETGLLVNSWYGKFHLEMHIWHLAYLVCFNEENKLEKHLEWYIKNKKAANLNAKKNNYKGFRWPKMIGPDAIDSPSVIAPLLVWQQFHIVYMLELIYQKTKSDKLLKKYWEIVKGTTDFVCDFLVYENGQYNLCPPIMPCQEEFDPTEVINPTFEIAYFKFGIGIANKWAKRLNISCPNFEKVYNKIAKPRIENGLYLAHKKCLDTYTNYTNDHPTQLAIYSFFDNKDIDKKVIKNTLNKVLKVWNEDSMWGWDYGYMAMLAMRLNDIDLAFDILLKKCPKNYYAKNGHNFQKGRTDLPAYLPGNGSLLLAISLLVSKLKNNSSWTVKTENMFPYPF